MLCLTIRGEISMLEAKNMVLFSTKPNAARVPATTTIVTKSNVIVASCLTACTICATFSRARTEFMNLFQAVCFWAKMNLQVG